MKTSSELWQEQIRQAVRESIGWGRDVSVKEASAITGIGGAVIYKIASGELVYPDKYLTDLMDIPAFADRLLTIRGHACAFIGNETGCAFEAVGSILSAGSVAAKAVTDRKISEPEKKRLADAFHRVITKCHAFVHKFKSERLAQRAGAR